MDGIDFGIDGLVMCFEGATGPKLRGVQSN
ncbi:hypothetical protein ACVIHB_003063 [Bradyrhizobium liaoningense]